MLIRKASDNSIIGNICELNDFLDVCERCNVCLPRIHYVHFPGRAREIIGRHNLVGTKLCCRGWCDYPVDTAAAESHRITRLFLHDYLAMH